MPSPRAEAVAYGPTWRRDADGSWLLPEITLGWEILGWTAKWLRQPDGPDAGEPWKFTPEQARFVLWWYALDRRGRLIYPYGVLRRCKGWGKDPTLAALAAVEFVGPCRFDGWGRSGEPIATRHPAAWIQLAAVSKEQNRNTMTLFPGLFSDEAITEFGVDLGKEIIYSAAGGRIEAVTSSPRSVEGGRPTFVGKNETQHWLSTNEGHDMAAVIDRNATKSRDGSTRALAVCNAHEPGKDSDAEHDWDAFQAMEQGRTKADPILYDSLEAPATTDLADGDSLRHGIRCARGDSDWLDEDRTVQTIWDPRTSPSLSRRYYLNQLAAAEDAWCAAHQWDARRSRRDGDGEDLPEVAPVTDGDEIALFFDGSKSDDATGLIGCRLSDGHVITLGCWQRPEKVQEWNAPREEVDDRVDHVFSRFTIAAFFADPGAGDDDSGERYWDRYIDGWAHRYGDQLQLDATPSGTNKHPIMWDMRSSANQKEFTQATERMLADITAGDITHDGDSRLREHVLNARRRPNRFGVTIGKRHREARQKVDLAVCAIGARMVRRKLLAGGGSKRKKPSGRMVGV